MTNKFNRICLKVNIFVSLSITSPIYFYFLFNRQRNLFGIFDLWPINHNEDIMGTIIIIANISSFVLVILADKKDEDAFFNALNFSLSVLNSLFIVVGVFYLYISGMH